MGGRKENEAHLGCGAAERCKGDRWVKERGVGRQLVSGPGRGTAGLDEGVEGELFQEGARRLMVTKEVREVGRRGAGARRPPESLECM